MTGILRLFAFRGPTTVARLVIPVVVDAINGKPWRTWPHVFQKLLEVFRPFAAHRNAASPIPLVGAAVFVEAPALYASPNAVLVRMRKSMRKTRAALDDLSVKTPTTPRLTRTYVGSSADDFLAAIAPAMPHRMFGAARRDVVICSLRDNKAPKALPKVVHSLHACTF
jgi:hypothetical protein